MRLMCQKFGIAVPDVEREVYIAVPGNVWSIMASLGFYTYGLGNTYWYVLELVKAMYGLVDAPAPWSIALRYFVICEVHGNLHGMMKTLCIGQRKHDAILVGRCRNQSC